MIYETQEQLNEALAYWQKALRLQDWEITARIVKQQDIPRSNGQCQFYWDKKDAVIRLLRVQDYEGANWTHEFEPQDHEVTLVHELLHLHFCAWQPDSEKDPHLYYLFEQTTEVLSKSIVKMHRESNVVRLGDNPHLPPAYAHQLGQLAPPTNGLYAKA